MSHLKFEEILPYKYAVTSAGVPSVAEVTAQICSDFQNYRMELVERVAKAIVSAEAGAGNTVIVDFKDRANAQKAKLGDRPLTAKVEAVRLSLVS